MWKHLIFASMLEAYSQSDSRYTQSDSRPQAATTVTGDSKSVFSTA